MQVKRVVGHKHNGNVMIKAILMEDDKEVFRSTECRSWYDAVAKARNWALDQEYLAQQAKLSR